MDENGSSADANAPPASIPSARAAPTGTTEPSTYDLSRWLFLRLLGLIYLIAFISLWLQLDGLIGQHGILPAPDFLQAVEKHLGAERFWRLPTLCWLNQSPGFLHCLCGAGVLISLGVVADIAPACGLLVLWAIYLSLSTVSREFLSFQWDILLLEAGFLGILYAPWRLWPRLATDAPPSPIVRWLLWWLLFRLMLASGVVKLASGDPTWNNLTALSYHYETQPLPTWIGWYAHQLPAWLHSFSTAVMFFIELLLPFAIFTNRLGRRIAAAAFTGLMLLILLTGNYCFFNLLTIALCVPVLDDRFWRPFCPRALRQALEPASARPRPARFRLRAHAVLAGLIVLISALQIMARFGGADRLPRAGQRLLEWNAPFRSINLYGLFAVMTTKRPEISVEGSQDGIVWREYEFKWKPGDLKRPPGFVQPHQPRLDWQMWFAALGDYQSNPWFIHFLVRLLQGAPDVLALLEKNPFPDQPPRYVRAVLYEYRFTDLATRRQTGAWWRRERKGLYCPEISLQQMPRGRAA